MMGPLTWELSHAAVLALKNKWLEMFEVSHFWVNLTSNKYRTPIIRSHLYRLASFFFVLFCLLSFLLFVAISWAAPAAYGGSQAMGPIGAVTASLHQSHCFVVFELRLRSTPQLTAMPHR